MEDETLKQVLYTVRFKTPLPGVYRLSEEDTERIQDYLVAGYEIQQVQVIGSAQDNLLILFRDVNR